MDGAGRSQEERGERTGPLNAATSPIVPSDRTSCGFSAGLNKPGPMRASHAHGDLELNFLYAGRARYFLAGKYVDLPAGTLAVFWAAMPHQVLEMEAGTEFLWLTIPFSMALRWNLGETFLVRLLRGELITDAGGLEWDVSLTRRWLDDLARREPSATRTVELEVEARLRRLACPAPSRPLSQGERHIEVVAAYLGKHFQQAITAKDIADAVKLHPNYVMSLFRRHCGMTLWQYLTRLRISHAQMLLLTTEKTVLSVALESGFGSLPRFYAAFTSECGMAPGEYRKRLG